MRIDEDRFLKTEISDGFERLFPNGATFQEIISAINEKKIPLEMLVKPGSEILDNEFIQEIILTIPNLFNISEHPRSFLNTIEESVPVEVAKKINFQAITKLSRDSNHWYSRTCLEVKPKTISSDTNEETLFLYENRFIVTLMERILKLVEVRKAKLENFVAKFEEDFRQTYLDANYRAGYQRISDRARMKSFLLSFSTEFGKSFYEKMVESLALTKNVERKIKAMQRMTLFQTLRLCERVRDPIQKTNTIMFDYRYNRCYKLWEYLKSKKMEEEISLDETGPEQLQNIYILYSVLNLIVAFFDSGFDESGSAVVKFEGKTTSFSRPAELVRNKDGAAFLMDIDHGTITLTHKYGESKHFEDTFNILPLYQDFENKQRMAIEEISSQIIDEKLVLSIEKNKKKKKAVSGRFAFLSIDVNRCSQGNNFGEKLYRRFFNIGDNYSSFESSSSLQKWSHYQTGIILISPLDLRLNILRIERLLNFHVFSHISFSEMEKQCPICGSKKNIKKDRNGDLICYDCHHRLTLSSCVNCKTTDILWIQQQDDKKFLSDSQVTEGLENQPYFVNLRQYESIMGENAITSFVLRKEKDRWRLKSICPKCGVELGEMKE